MQNKIELDVSGYTERIIFTGNIFKVSLDKEPHQDIVSQDKSCSDMIHNNIFSNKDLETKVKQYNHVKITNKVNKQYKFLFDHYKISDEKFPDIYEVQELLDFWMHKVLFSHCIETMHLFVYLVQTINKSSNETIRNANFIHKKFVKKYLQKLVNNFENQSPMKKMVDDFYYSFMKDCFDKNKMLYSDIDEFVERYKNKYENYYSVSSILSLDNNYFHISTTSKFNGLGEYVVNNIDSE